MVKIVDCFMFYNELDMLFYRLSVLYDLVDSFIICEASRTQMGKSKPFYFLDNIQRFERFLDKIVHVQMTDENTDWFKNPDINKKEQWKNENMQRNGIARGIRQLSLNNEDCLMISDLDEIPNPSMLRYVLEGQLGKEIGGVNISMDFYYYNLTCFCTSEKWDIYAKIVRYDVFVRQFEFIPQNIRNVVFPHTFQRGGWHLSYFGDVSFIQNKMTNCSHQEFNTIDITNAEQIKDAIRSCRDFLKRPNTHFVYLPIDQNPFLPPKINIDDATYPF